MSADQTDIAPSERPAPSAAPSAAPRKLKRAGINRLHGLRNLIIDVVRWYYTRIWGMDLHPTVQFSLSTKFDKTWPKGIHVGENSYLAFDVRMLSHDRTRGLFVDTRIGRNCFIGGCTIILPGVEIGDNCVIGAGSVITKSIPSGSIAAGNPAKVVRSGIEVGPYGRFANADAIEADLAAAFEGGAG